MLRFRIGLEWRRLLVSLTRKLIRRESYQGRMLEARFMGPDLLAFVDGIELNCFYLDAQAAIDAGKRHVDAELKAEREKAEKAAKAAHK